MITKIEFNNITWVDVSEPTETDFAVIKEDYKLQPLIASEFLLTLKRPKIEKHKSQLWLVLHFPRYDGSKRTTEPAELDFIVTDHTLITVHSKSLLPLEVFIKDCQVQNKIKEETFKNFGVLQFHLIDILINASLPMLDHIHDDIDIAEEKVFCGQGKEMLQEIAIIKRNIINFRRTIKPQKGILEALVKTSEQFFSGAKLEILANDLISSNIRVWNILENHKERIEAIERTNGSLLTYRTNEIIKTLTFISGIAFPLTVFIGFFAMDVFGAYDFTQNPLSPVIIGGIIIAFICSMILYFRSKKWF
ncbi:MAG: hypothetical protein COU81_00570 [Candidatus Portnoybacteria bacterium CG10_big_fil_rev_8_21_14_0_10_36_7]|uniref:Magnesium transporter CorA n=1 Tax=Candidatus Portnoybacteria bacterium CG10_big_fil_rev_8_21_14_0_10_36_7 TaxID=1974812 RepID=A0A2M8KEW0_9BACT|nr:MAG: hypothetical protein COU81_00570 [Candidatus Portnoybacteria bacterium CG10_big_fil_rev_8_21_14_0_10_36_7]